MPLLLDASVELGAAALAVVVASGVAFLVAAMKSGNHRDAERWLE
jgi:hypothetical protein